MSDKIFLSAYRRLLQGLGPRNWWPADSPFEMMVGAILTQNTSWINVKKAIGQLRERGLLDPRKLNHLTIDEIAPLIRSSGYYNMKAERLKQLLAWFAGYDYSIQALLQHHRASGYSFLRSELLAIKGVGPETADSILCYALKRPHFVVDAYTFRWLHRYRPGLYADNYEELQAAVEAQFNSAYRGGELTYHLQEFHALIVYLSKYTCRKKSPDCHLCPLKEDCQSAL